VASPHAIVTTAISYRSDGTEGGEVTLVWARSVAVSMFVAGIVVGNSAFVARADDQRDPPKLDVETVLTKLADRQVYRAPGAVASFDTELVREELPDDVRLLIGPYRNPDYSNEEYHDQVYRPLHDWVEDNGLSLIHVQGVSVSTVVGTGDLGRTAVPSDLPGVQHLTAYRDVTSLVRTAIATLQDGRDADEVDDDPEATTVTPSEQQVDKLAKRLRDERIYNAPDRSDRIQLPLGKLRENIGETVRIVALPGLTAGEPLVEYAPALAKRFPDDLVFVAHGRWLEVAGGDQDKLTSARNYVFGRSIRVALRDFVPMRKMLLNVVGRYDTLHSQQPFSRPQPVPFDIGRTIAALAPWLLGGSALLLGGIPVVRWWRDRVGTRAAEHTALRQRKARTHSAIIELGSRVYADTGAVELRAAATERYETARELFAEAHTAQAMEQVRGVVTEGNDLLDRAERETQ